MVCPVMGIRAFILAVFLVGSSAQATVINTFMTGVDESNSNALLADNAADSNWSITAITSSDGTVPRAATVTYQDDTPSGWTAPIAGTRIITRGTSVSGVNGTYTYTYQFTLNTALQSNFNLSGLVWADDQVRVLLNGNQIMALSAVIYNQPAVSFSTANQSYFVNGINALTFEVVNSGGGPTGIDVSGTITANTVPEPGQWAMMAVALGGIAMFLKRDGWARLRELVNGSAMAS